MKVPISWLSEYVDIDLPPNELAHLLTMSGTEAESTRPDNNWEGIFVGQVLDVRQHPNADRLKLVKIFDGEFELDVICGAPNIKSNQKIAFANVGAKLLDPYADDSGKYHKLKRSKIRGIVSNGMICSEKELGLSDNHEGILVLDPNTTVGIPIKDLLGDDFLDLELTPNRPDCLGILGVAREIAALTGKKMLVPDGEYQQEGDPIDKLIDVSINDSDLCLRYTGSVIQGLKIGPSPKWLTEKLISIGERPINNVVDVTNYVMFEYGQPLHAFDYDKITDHEIIVRRAISGEKITTIDGRERALDNEMLLISDPSHGVGLAGIMGAMNSEIGGTTTDIFLESATFEGANNRRTARALDLRSQATLRFEKGLRTGLADIALRRAIKLILQVAGGRAAVDIVDCNPGGQNEQGFVELEERKLASVLGVSLRHERVLEIIKSLGMSIEPKNEGWVVEIPYWRTDISIPEDLIEEIARIEGYDNIPMSMPTGRIPQRIPDHDIQLNHLVVNSLVSSGMQEIISYSATTVENEFKSGYRSKQSLPIRLANPVSSDFITMRRTLRDTVLKTVTNNLKTWRGPISIFELGHTFQLSPKEGSVDEEVMVAGALAGPAKDLHWSVPMGKADFYDVKGIVENLMLDLHLEAKFIDTEDTTFSNGRVAKIMCENREVGVLGDVRDEVLQSFEIDVNSVSMFELNLTLISDLMPDHVSASRYRPYIRYQGSERDLDLIMDKSVNAGSLTDLISMNRLVTSVTVFDIYDGDNIDGEKKSMTIRVGYRSSEKTLTASELKNVEDTILNQLERKLGVIRRL